MGTNERDEKSNEMMKMKFHSKFEISLAEALWLILFFRFSLEKINEGSNEKKIEKARI